MVDYVLMPPYRGEHLAGGGVPNTGRFVAAARDDTAAIRAERGMANGALVLQASAHRPCRRGLPDLRCPIFAESDYASAVGAEGGIVYGSLVRQLPDEPPGRCRPQARYGANGDQVLPIRA